VKSCISHSSEHEEEDSRKQAETRPTLSFCKVRQTHVNTISSRAYPFPVETCSWNSWNSCCLLKLLEMLLKRTAVSRNSWNAWNSNHFKIRAGAHFHHGSLGTPARILKLFRTLLKCAFETLEALAISWNLLKCSWNVLLSLETLEMLDTALETLLSQTRLV